MCTHVCTQQHTGLWFPHELSLQLRRPGWLLLPAQASVRSHRDQTDVRNHRRRFWHPETIKESTPSLQPARREAQSTLAEQSAASAGVECVCMRPPNARTPANSCSRKASWYETWDFQWKLLSYSRSPGDHELSTAAFSTTALEQVPSNCSGGKTPNASRA